MPILAWVLRCIMGSGSSVSSHPSSPELKVTEVNRRNSVYTEKWNGHVITNDVAPVLISRDCCEEFQINIDKQKPVLGAISEGNSEHALIQGMYFLVLDHFKGIDEINTLPKYGVVNFRTAGHGFPVYGMGQPSGNGLHNVMNFLQRENIEDVIFLNLRDEPVLFLSHKGDLKPYTPRNKDSVLQNISSRGRPTEIEAIIAKEVVEIATTDEDNQFYFYDDVMNLMEDPHKYHVQFLDDFQTTEQVFAQYILPRPNTKYLRFPCSSGNTPSDVAVDSFLNLVKEIPDFFDKANSKLPAFVVNCHTGQGRTTVAMVMCCLLLSHKKGCQQQIKCDSMVSDDHLKGEGGTFLTVLRLIELLPKGLQMKNEVDILIDICGELINIREEMYDSKVKMASLQQDYNINGVSARLYFKSRTLKYLERYCFLIIFNSYLHDQFSHMFLYSFQSWIRQQPDLVRLLSQRDCCQENESLTILTKGGCVLVSDESLDNDVMGSTPDVGVSNFRCISGIPVYGVAQPTFQGLEKLVPYLTDNKASHPVVHFFNLRSDLVVECDGQTYTLKYHSDPSANIFYKNNDVEDLEQKEAKLKNEILQEKGPLQVHYTDTKWPAVAMEFKSAFTLRELYKSRGSDKLIYHHLPMSCHETAPKEQNFDSIVNVLRDLEEFYTDEDGPALLFSCHSGKTWTTVGMVIAGLVCWHKRGFPIGTKVGQQERTCVQNAEYTKGEFAVVMQLVRRLPKGLQVKREVDLMLDKCSETMTPMHYHLREVIFATCNKVKSCSSEHKKDLLMLSLAYLERYIYLILFNCYLHMERAAGWRKTFTTWMKETGSKVGAYTILDNLNFHDVDGLEDTDVYCCRERWKEECRIKEFPKKPPCIS
ncbi:paladin-like isoform X2 [Anneissia japonica]|uniref:paladin-like isoform X1 n=2 Tax=Anneissia japonica TaxID=1529436 RepID=UPI0014258372|nr:paladin-like isoform X1 [Anneissia japonica]XP_033103116.1 paladin-like isoform X2 [Anneissia japonica]